MGTVGEMEFVWSQGYDGGRIAFLNDDVLCYVCGHNIEFIKRQNNGKFQCNVESDDYERNTAFVFQGQGVGVFTVHNIQSHFAVAERCLNPQVFVYRYPECSEISRLEGGARLEYSHVEFSASIYIATVSSIPDYFLTLWNYHTGQMLSQSNLSHMAPTSVAFNPGNWRQICVTMETELSVWTVEASDDVFMMKQRKLKLPPANQRHTSEVSANRASSRNSSRNTQYTMDLPKAAIAGLVGEIVERLDDIQDTTVRASPVSIAWTPAGDIFIGCKGGQLLQIDGESWQLYVRYNPEENPTSPSHNTFGVSEGTSHLEYEQMLFEGSLSCLLLHKLGLYAAGEDGILRSIDISTPRIDVIETCPIGAPISKMAISRNYRNMVIASSKGSIHIYTPGAPDLLYEYIDLHYGPIIDLAMLSPGTEHVMSLRADGEIQAWNLNTGALVSSIPVGIQTTCMASSPIVPLLAVGTASGHVYFFDCSDLTNLRIIQRHHLYTDPITHLKFQHYGEFLLSAADDSPHIFVIDGSPKTTFDVLGYTDIDCSVTTLSMATDPETMNTRVVVTYQLDDDNPIITGATHVTQFDITYALFSSILNSDSREMFKSLRNDFKDESLRKLTYTFSRAVHGITMGQQNALYGIDEDDKQIVQIMLPQKKPHRRDVDGWILSPVATAAGHLLPGGTVTMSPHFQWVVSQGTDGAVHILSIHNLELVTKFTPHDFNQGGVAGACFDNDCTNLVTIGHDNIIACHRWSGTSFFGTGKNQGAIEAARSRSVKLLTSRLYQESKMKTLPDWDPPPVTPREESPDIQKERECATDGPDDEIYTTPTPTLSCDSTWLEQQERTARKQEDQEFLESKRELRVKIRDVRRTIQQMMRENDTRPDIEQLSHHEFDLDLEEQARLQAEGDQEVNRIRDEIEFENLAKMYLKDQIMKECWDDMVVKGRSIEGFISHLEVANFPLQAIPKHKLQHLERVTARRQLEVDELKIRMELLEVGLKTSVEDIEAGDGDEDQNVAEQASTAGSLALEFGGGNPLFHSQFELHSRLQKLDQIVLLEDALRRIKENFNAQFDEVYKKKSQEIQKIREKNKRIHKILKDLNLQDPVIQPEFSDKEQPENALIVIDEEVTVERYLTAEQKRLQQLEREKEEERIRLEMGDNWRERGLDQMMGGLLEIKKEDELKKDVPVPMFMREGKDPGNWNEEELKIAKEYERKCAELEEEREKFRKQLETELRKLQALIHDSMAAFDEILYTLFIKKTKSQMVIYQEELKVMRLRYSLLKEEELETREAELNYMQEVTLNAKNESAKRLVESREQVEAFRENYDIIVAEDKILDKQFKREFNDCTALQVEQLYKLFRKRPKGQKYRIAESNPISTPLNPFCNRPSTAMKEECARTAMEAFLIELDSPENKPDGVNDETWERLCHLRAQKVESETNVKIKTNVMADMMAYCAARQEEDEALKENVERIVGEITKLKEERLRFMNDLDVQLVLRQGQVEVDQGVFVPSYLDSVLVHRGVVEDLNVKIKQLGESKICSMLTSKKSRKGIVKLEWEYKRMLMNIEDLQNKMKDVTFMKVTREIQLYLMNKEEYDAMKNQDILNFESTISLRRRQHEDQLKEKRQSMQKLTRLSKGKASENVSLDDHLSELNVTLNERKHIDSINAEERSDPGTDKNYKKIVQRRKLVDLAKAQAQEVAVLRAEVERLRMRTFPALVQVER